MNTFQLWWTSIGKKLVNSISGLALVAFVCVHLIGNLTLLVNDGGDLFNSYAHHLESLGPLLKAVEIGLILIFLAHIVSALSVRLGGRAARPDRYEVVASKGGPSKQTLSSRSMLVTGLLIAVFVVLHVWMFKYNGGQAFEMTEVNGKPVKDLYLVVVNAFSQAPIAFGYAGIMLLLGLHLRHGFWSALQSLGAAKPKWSPMIYSAGLFFACLLAAGFIFLPMWIFFSAQCGADCSGGVP